MNIAPNKVKNMNFFQSEYGMVAKLAHILGHRMFSINFKRLKSYIVYSENIMELNEKLITSKLPKEIPDIWKLNKISP